MPKNCQKFRKIVKNGKKPRENPQKYRKTIKNLKTGKKQTKISKIRQNIEKLS